MEFRIPDINLSAKLSNEVIREKLSKNPQPELNQLLQPSDVFNALADIRKSKKEHFVAFFLDSRNKIITREIVSIGTINASLVHPREVFNPAVRSLAVQIILAHNHPSGNLEASEEDISVNKRLVEAGKILGIEVLDHIIVTASEFISFKDKGII